MSNPGTLNGDSIFKLGVYSSTSKLRQIKQNREYIYIFLKVATVGFALCIKKRRKKKTKRKQKESNPTVSQLSLFFLQPLELILFCSMIINKKAEGKANRLMNFRY